MSDGAAFVSTNPATGEVVWRGNAASESQINAAVIAARNALPQWADKTLCQRIAYLEPFAEQLKQHKQDLAEAICRETGKPRWEALAEVDAMIGKVPISIRAYHERRQETSSESAGVVSATRYKPFGVMAVIGPFNMPGHLPNGHIVPALLAGNTVVFKPSELTPLVGQKMAEVWNASKLPEHVFQIVQGGRETGAAFVRHPGIDGVLFTGSVAGGMAISRTLVDQPGKIVALEMGGNNPLVVWDAADHEAAAYMIIQSAFITAGQRCSCARRLIIPSGARGEAIIEHLMAMMKKIRVAPYTAQPEPFMGPVITDGAAESLLRAQEHLIERGGKALMPMRVLGPTKAMLSSGLIDVTNIADRPDVEFFGPLLQVIRVADFDAAIAEANNTKFGLAAGLLSDDVKLWELFYCRTRAGVVYFNRQTTGGSSALSFGGTGLSGNHRPSGYFAADYCSYPVASMETTTLAMPEKKSPGIESLT